MFHVKHIDRVNLIYIMVKKNSPFYAEIRREAFREFHGRIVSPGLDHANRFALDIAGVRDLLLRNVFFASQFFEHFPASFAHQFTMSF